jgi:hypothetical protein
MEQVIILSRYISPPLSQFVSLLMSTESVFIGLLIHESICWPIGQCIYLANDNIQLNTIMWNGNVVNCIRLIYILPNRIMLNGIVLNGILLNDILLNNIIMTGILLNGIILNNILVTNILLNDILTNIMHLPNFLVSENLLNGILRCGGAIPSQLILHPFIPQSLIPHSLGSGPGSHLPTIQHCSKLSAWGHYPALMVYPAF